MLMGLLFLSACSEETSITASDEGDRFAIMQLSFDLESVSFGEILDRGNEGPAYLDDIGTEMSAIRQSVEIMVYPDGRTDYTLIKQEPKHATEHVFTEAPPGDDVPVIHRTEVRGRTISFYTKAGTKIAQQELDDDFSLLEDIQKIKGTFDWEKDARESGATVEQLTENTIRIQKPFDLPEGKNNEHLKSSGAYFEQIYVTDLGLVLGGSLYDGDGVKLFQSVNKYTYREAEEDWVPEIVYYEDHQVNPVTRTSYVTKTTNYYENWVGEFQ